ncbi:MAG TPA: hypothetical protein DCK83_00565 [Gallionellaceae bacterium]|nr:hypothetical protein [Gallionellaceae bacterium]
MAITNTEAMQQLNAAKARAKTEKDNYWHGIFVGESGAYWLAGVITIEQYKELLDFNQAVPA